MNSSVKFDADLIKKYDSRAPRYTSYPTAPQFHTKFDESHFNEHAQRSNASLLPKDLSVYVHVPFYHSLCYFCGCNKAIKQPNDRKVDDYLERLYHEITLRGRLFSEDRLVTQIHFGGGTPSFLRLDQIADVLDQIATQFHLDLPNNLEIGIELDPVETTPILIENLSKLGFSHFSIGIQDFSRDVNREQAKATTLALIDAAMRTSGMVNIDLISGLPKQTLSDFENSLEKVISSGATRITVYNFANLPKRIKAQLLIAQSTSPPTNRCIEFAQLVRKKLLGAGYLYIGMDLYALPTDLLAIAQSNNSLQRSFHGYTTHKETDLIGVGVNAISKFDTAFAQNESRLSLYNELIDTKSLPISKGIILSEDDRIRAGIIQQIMCRPEIDLSYSISHYIDRDCNISLFDYFNFELTQLESFETDGLINRTSNGFRITENGRHFMHMIAKIFDRYLNPKSKSDDRQVLPFSRGFTDE